MRTIKIFNEEKEIYNGSCSVNMVLFRGRIFGEIQKINDRIIKFTLQLSNGKDPRRPAHAVLIPRAPDFIVLPMQDFIARLKETRFSS